jgi:hypothetical protein
VCARPRIRVTAKPCDFVGHNSVARAMHRWTSVYDTTPPVTTVQSMGARYIVAASVLKIAYVFTICCTGLCSPHLR